MKKLPTIPPAPGGAVLAADPEPRPQVTAMLSPESEKEFEASLPDSTATPEAVEDKPRRKRRTKEEMAQARGEAPTAPPVDDDPRLTRCRSKFASLGASGAIKAGFAGMGKPLDRSETEDVEDYFYMVGSKGGLDPTKSWVAMFFCAFLLLARLVFMRTDLGDQLKKFLFPEEKKEPKPDEKNDQPKP
jgi:hypothetical protein